MIAKISSLRWGVVPALLVNLPGILQLSASACTGLCGNCGGSCAVAGLTAGGFLAAARFYKRVRSKTSLPKHNTTGILQR